MPARRREPLAFVRLSCVRIGKPRDRDRLADRLQPADRRDPFGLRDAAAAGDGDRQRALRRALGLVADVVDVAAAEGGVVGRVAEIDLRVGAHRAAADRAK